MPRRRRFHRRRRIRPGRNLFEHGALRRLRALRQRLFVRAHLLSLDSRPRVRLSDGARLHLALGHRLVLVFEERRRSDPVDPPPLRPQAARLENLSAHHALEQSMGIDEGAGSSARGYAESVIQDVDIPIGNAAAIPRLLPARDRDRARVGLPDDRHRMGGPLSPLQARSAAELYVNFGFWDVSGVRRDSRRTTSIECSRTRLSRWAASSRSIRKASSAARRFDRMYGGDAYRVLKTKYDPDGAFPSSTTSAYQGPDGQGSLLRRLRGRRLRRRRLGSGATRWPGTGFRRRMRSRRLRAAAPQRRRGRHTGVSLRRAELPCPAPRGSSCSSPPSGPSQGTSCTRPPYRVHADFAAVSAAFARASSLGGGSLARTRSRRKGLRRGRRRFA